jgi:aspartate/tyrosine/aromatic aminotransferase
VTADLLRRLGGGDTIWLTKPTWANHGAIFEAAGLRTAALPYYDPGTHGLAYGALVESLSKVAPGDMVVLHGCCHNPTGVDPTLEQWTGIADALEGRGALLLVDFAYQGFVNGVDEDAAAVRMLAERMPEMVVCSSFSKNLGLYAERTGSMTAITASAEKAAAVLSQTKKAVRTNYSNPPVHGSAIVTEILADTELRSQWLAELTTMRERIQAMRVRLAEALDARGVRLGPEGNGFVIEQNGMFSFSGLSKDEVLRLREEHAVYMVDSGRLNVAGITEDNLDRLCDAIAAVRRVPATV